MEEYTMQRVASGPHCRSPSTTPRPVVPTRGSIPEGDRRCKPPDRARAPLADPLLRRRRRRRSKFHFWAPTFKWGISIANIADFAKPPENISYPQQVAVACTGLIWSRYSLVITPKNWNLFSVNVAMAGTGLYQLSRKIRQDYLSDEKDVAPQLEA
ncbi:hypothetical protein U9M48_040388 [Paspalum notatum var. saurae]|uniref:Mitochondrial pyruvate carrier n=1 Tax=Paspalum notatum var. saurae TaxID=547442 RepID=A0AAQ3UKX4_PASNO